MVIKTDEKKLNTEQLKAIKHGKGPLLIIAGAGTGKTTVITERVKWLISQKMAQPGELLALTFTEKAAREMEERIDVALPYGYTQMWITTFHAFGERILRQEALQIGLDPGYKLMTQAEAIIFLRKNLFKFDLNYFRPLGNPNKFIEGMLQHFSRLKDEDIEPKQYLVWAKSQISKLKTSRLSGIHDAVMRKNLQTASGQSQDEKLEKEKYLELACAYKTHEELKFKEGVMDFSDLISNTLKLFRVRKNLLKEYQNRFKFILIDEFQDTNFAQNELAILLTGNTKNITVVGDDDQAIYRWRGAAISNIIQFKKRFPQSKLVILNKNYRSTQEILDSAYKLIQNNNPDRLEVKENVNKKLQSERLTRGGKIEFTLTKKVEDEADEVVEKIKAQQSEGVYNWKDFAILIRANNQAEPFIRALVRAGIPYQFLGPGILFRQAEIKDLIAYLKFLHNFLDSVAFFRVLSMPIFDISSRDLVALNNFVSRVGISLFEGAEVIVSFAQNDTKHWSRGKNYQSFLPNINDQSKNILAKILKMINRHFDLIKKQETAGQILYYFLEDTGILLKLTKYKDIKEEKMALNISKFFDKLKTFESEHDDASVAAVVEFLDMSMELGESPLVAETDWTENDAVNILTVHSSKGLEFPVVFLVNLVTNRFPTISRRERIPIPDELVKEILPEGDYHLEEERRLFYVGMTRARDYLFLAASNYYGEGKRERKISPFVVETLGEENVVRQPLNSARIKQLTLIEWKKNEELQGQVVKTPIEYLSYSQIDTFMTCPLQYKYRYILKIPVPQNAAGSFGTSIHATLQKFYEERKGGKYPTKNKLFKLLDRVWIPIGYGTKQYEEKMKKRGIDMLTDFYDKFYDPKIVPKSLEQVFKIKLSNDLKIGGKIDRVDETRDGKLEIIDYKTGKKSTEKQIKENLQMTVYGLAATDPGIYNRKSDEVILSFYFLGTQEKVSSTRTNDELDKARKILLTKAEEISTSNFKPKVGPWCDFCDFRLICEAWQ